MPSPLVWLQEELRRYQPALLECPAVVVANKVDATEDPKSALAALKAATSHPIVPFSAARGLGVDLLKQVLRAVVSARTGVERD